MKKTIALIGLFIISGFLFGQLNVGIKGAITSSKLVPDASEWEQVAKTGMQFGGFARLGKKIHLQPEVYFSAKGGQLNVSIPDPQQTSKLVNAEQLFTITGIDIPLLLGVKLIDMSSFNFRLHAGPVASFVTNKKYKLTYDGIEQPEENSLIPVNSLKDFTWALQAGAGLDLFFLTLDVRYEYGISNMIENPNDVIDGISEFRNNIFFVSLGWKIF